jgi:hypothetical protein
VTMPTGLVKSMIQASGFVRRTRSAMSRKTAGPGGLLADAAAFERPGLVLVARGLPSDAELEEHRVRVGDPGVQVGGGDDLPRVALLGEDPPCQAADQFQPVGGRVDEHEFLDRQGVPQPRESVDQFGGVGGPATNYCELHGSQPFTPVRVTPSTKAFCAKKNTMMTGAMTSSVAAMVRFQLTAWALLKDSRP